MADAAFYREFNLSHTELWSAVRRGRKHAEYLPLLRTANDDARRYSLMKANWGDPIC